MKEKLHGEGTQQKQEARINNKTDIVAKSHGSSNPYNMVRATLDGLKNSTTAGQVAAKRGLTVEEIFA